MSNGDSFDLSIPDLQLSDPAGDVLNFSNFSLSNFGGPAATGAGGLSGFSGGDSSAFFDSQTGQIVTLSQITADPALSMAFQTQFGQAPQNFSSGLPTSMTSPLPTMSGQPSSLGRDSSTNPNAPQGLFSGPGGMAGLIALLGGGGVGLAGIIQALTGGGRTSSTQVTGPPPTAAQSATQQAGLQNLQAGQQFAFGGAPGMTNPSGQMTSQGGQGGGQGGTQGGLAGLLQGQQGGLNAAFLQALQQQAGQIQGNPFLGQQMPQFLANQVGNFGQQQGSLLGMQGVGASQLAPQIQGAASGALQGNLPPLSPQLLDLINQQYQGAQSGINQFLDTSLQNTLERARHQGFAGGLEQLGQGTPGTIMAPAMQTATQAEAGLQGQKAQQILQLMQSLPQMGAGLAGQGQGLLNQASGAFNTPFANTLQGGSNLAGLNQSVIQSLLGTNQQGLQGQNQFLSALGGQTGAASGLSNALQPIGQTQTNTQPFSLLNAFGPTSQLLGGVGGLFTGLGQQNQQAQTNLLLQSLLARQGGTGGGP